MSLSPDEVREACARACDESAAAWERNHPDMARAARACAQIIRTGPPGTVPPPPPLVLPSNAGELAEQFSTAVSGLTEAFRVVLIERDAARDRCDRAMREASDAVDFEHRAQRERDEALGALRRIAFDPFGAPEASHDQVLEAITAFALGVIAPRERVGSDPQAPVRGTGPRGPAEPAGSESRANEDERQKGNTSPWGVRRSLQAQDAPDSRPPGWEWVDG